MFNSTTFDKIKPELITDKVKEVLNFEKETDKKAVVLSSGGLDSLVVLKYAIERFGAENTISLDCFYGQNHDIEMSCSKRIAEHFGAQRIVIDISDVFKYSGSAMLAKNKDKIVHASYYDQIYGENGTYERHSVSTYCPNRNAILINCAGAIALSFGAEYVLIGAHADDSAGAAYKDCTKQFVDAISKSLEEGTDPEVHLIAPLINLNKTENVTLGTILGLTPEEFAMSFSCYDPIEIEPGKYKICQTCGTDIDRLNALKANDIDPMIDTIYTREEDLR